MGGRTEFIMGEVAAEEAEEEGEGVVESEGRWDGRRPLVLLVKMGNTVAWESFVSSLVELDLT